MWLPGRPGVRACGLLDRAETTSRTLAAIVERLDEGRPIEAGLVRSQILATEGRSGEAGAALCRVLESAPPGFAGWTIPIDPFLAQVHGTKAFADVRGRLAQRAR